MSTQVYQIKKIENSLLHTSTFSYKIPVHRKPSCRVKRTKNGNSPKRRHNIVSFRLVNTTQTEWSKRNNFKMRVPSNAICEAEQVEQEQKSIVQDALCQVGELCLPMENSEEKVKKLVNFQLILFSRRIFSNCLALCFSLSFYPSLLFSCSTNADTIIREPTQFSFVRFLNQMFFRASQRYLRRILLSSRPTAAVATVCS